MVARLLQVRTFAHLAQHDVVLLAAGRDAVLHDVGQLERRVIEDLLGAVRGCFGRLDGGPEVPGLVE